VCPEARLALLQLAIEEPQEAAILDEERGMLPACCWLVDVCVADTDEAFARELAATCQWLLLGEGGIVLLGFALSADLPKMRQLLPEAEAATESVAPRVIDLQAVAVKAGCGSNGQVPSLRAVVECWMPGLTLNKDEQCSDWTQRPLSASQLEYATLDAVVLLELKRRMLLEAES
ncbi:unnamed protein product, partial [Polarella glacialis]